MRLILFLFLLFFSIQSYAKETVFTLVEGHPGNKQLYEALLVKEIKSPKNKDTYIKRGKYFDCQKNIQLVKKYFETYSCNFQIDSAAFKIGFITKGVENKHHIGLGGSAAKELFEKTKGYKSHVSTYTNIKYERKNFGFLEVLKTSYEDNEIPTTYNLSIKIDVKI